MIYKLLYEADRVDYSLNWVSLDNASINDKENIINEIKDEVSGKIFHPFKEMYSKHLMVKYYWLRALLETENAFDIECNVFPTSNAKFNININSNGPGIKLIYNNSTIERVQMNTIQFIEELGGKVMKEAAQVMI